MRDGQLHAILQMEQICLTSATQRTIASQEHRKLDCKRRKIIYVKYGKRSRSRKDHVPKDTNKRTKVWYMDGLLHWRMLRSLVGDLQWV